MVKSRFQDELLYGMQRELQSHDKKQGMNDLVKAADYLNSAAEIFEEAGLTAKADQVLRILGKLALAQDVDNAQDEDFYNKVLKWLDKPGTPVDPENIQENEEIEFTSINNPEDKVEEFEFTSLAPKDEAVQSKEDFIFQSIAAELGLTPEVLAVEDDLLNAEIGEEPLVVSENESEKTFEDAD